MFIKLDGVRRLPLDLDRGRTALLLAGVVIGFAGRVHALQQVREAATSPSDARVEWADGWLQGPSAESAPAGDKATAADVVQAAPSSEAAGKWKFEITPYLWAASISGDVTTENLDASIDLKFEDLLDDLDFGGGILGVAQYERWVSWLQLDYLKLSTSDLDSPPAGGSLDTEFTMLTAGLGRQFQTFGEASTIDVLLGLRYTRLENDLTINGVGSASKTNELTDPTLLLRPAFQLTKRLRFNATLAIGGGGDSDLVYEMQPNLQYTFDNGIAARLGYRRVHYEASNSGREFEGDMDGPLFGLGFRF